MSPELALFGRVSRANQCPVSGVKQPCRRNPETAEFGPICDISWIEIPQCSVLPRNRDVLSYGWERRSGNQLLHRPLKLHVRHEKARVHHAARRRGGYVAA